MGGKLPIEEQQEARINVRVKGPMAAHLASVIGPNGTYENQSEYIRDLIGMAFERPIKLGWQHHAQYHPAIAIRLARL